MDRTVKLRGFDITHTNYNAACCTHCNYDMGYGYVHCSHDFGVGADEVMCPECFTKQIRTNPNRAPDGWHETNGSAQRSMAHQADHSSTETYRVLEHVSGHRVYDFEFPTGLSWSDVSDHQVNWHLEQIVVTWIDGSQSRFNIGYGELEDLEDSGDYLIQTYDGDEVY